jgi:cytidylate kinase
MRKRIVFVLLICAMGLSACGFGSAGTPGKDGNKTMQQSKSRQNTTSGQQEGDMFDQEARFHLKMLQDINQYKQDQQKKIDEEIQKRKKQNEKKDSGQ